MGWRTIILQQIVNGLILGSFYSLVALGYSMVYGIIKLLNFAHGDVYMFGAFIGYVILGLVSGILGNGWAGVLVAMVCSMSIVGVFGVVIQRLAYRPLYSASRLCILISAVGVSLILSNSVMVATNGDYIGVKTAFTNAGIDLLGIHVTFVQMLMVSFTAALMVVLSSFISRSMVGKAMRAIALDHDTCRLMGINVYKIIAVTFFVGSALAAAAGMMAGIYYGQIHYFMGFLIGLKAFTAAVIGGIGSIPGAMIGGLILGMLEAAGTQFPHVGSAYKDVFSFAILILILIFKPTGLFGKSEIERM
ncbi:MAG: branched-chain amino acid ABC transporter permease [Holophaga sp.]|jgi:branched-chain amino acid transport system permease protein